MAIKLIDYTGNLSRGMILRCRGKVPYEKIVDFMIVESGRATSPSYSLMVSSGYKAGLVYSVLPDESIPSEDDGYAVNLSWLKMNWGKWGYFECPLNEVYVLENQPPESMPN
ncbi:Imm45 family immunity protein [Acidovorax sp. SUPP3334]|uniref:Imm45 family immunity protein n=1 Tax=Acidovorax sp. SUPP3334 TaxID=2920881 RepID=UPI0032EA0DB4